MEEGRDSKPRCMDELVDQDHLLHLGLIYIKEKQTSILFKVLHLRISQFVPERIRKVVYY